MGSSQSSIHESNITEIFSFKENEITFLKKKDKQWRSVIVRVSFVFLNSKFRDQV
jgi:hypothetical protein